MNNARKVYVDEIEVAGRLSILGVSEDALCDAAQWGLSWVAGCTAFDPPFLAGVLGSGRIVRGLRERLVPLGWAYGNPRGWPITIHPTGSFAIAVAAGDLNTGQKDATPATRSEKGSATRDAIARNFQPSFHTVDSSFPRPVDELAPMETWFLLHCVDEADGSIRLELSQPAGMATDGHVTKWLERIILKAVPFGPTDAKLAESPLSGGDNSIVVRVERKAAG